MSDKLINKYVGKTIKQFHNAGYDEFVGNFQIEFTDGTIVEFDSCGCCGGISMMGDAIKPEVDIMTAERRAAQRAREEAEAAEQRKRGLIA